MVKTTYGIMLKNKADFHAYLAANSGKPKRSGQKREESLIKSRNNPITMLSMGDWVRTPSEQYRSYKKDDVGNKDKAREDDLKKSSCFSNQMIYCCGPNSSGYEKF